MIFPCFFLLQIFTFKDLNLAENLTNVADTLKKVGSRRIHGTYFSNSRDPLGIVKGKSRAKALLKPACTDHSKDPQWGTVYVFLLL